MKNKKLKVAFLSFFSGEVYRGNETYVHELANRLTKLGHEVVVYQNGPKLPKSKYKTVSIGLKVDQEKRSYVLLPPFLNYHSLLIKKFTQKVLLSIEPTTDIIVATNNQWQSYLCKFWAKKNSTKLVIVGQSGVGFEERLSLWAFPDIFVALTGYQEKVSKRRNPFVRTTTIPNGVDLSTFHPRVNKTDFGLPRPVILLVGALVLGKRQELAIKAVSGLSKGSIVLAGDGSDKQKLKKLCKELLPERHLIKSFKYQEMPGVYAGSDLFTFPCVSWESFGIVLLEAMASGLPVVVTDDEKRREVVGDAGIFVEPTDTNLYSKALEEALSRNWGTKPRDQARRFSWDNIAEKYQSLFLEIVK